MKLNLKYNEWTPVPYSNGTIENTNTQATIEVNNSQTAGGVVLYPSQRITFNEQMYVRSMWDTSGVVANVVDFAEKGGGGGEGGASSVEVVQITIPTTGWIENDSADYPLKITIENAAFTSQKIANLVMTNENQATANECGLSPVCETGAGGLVLYAAQTPTKNIQASVNLWEVE